MHYKKWMESGFSFNPSHTCQLFLFWRNSSSFRSKKENDFIMCSCFCSNLCIVMYRKFRNVPLFKFFSLICSSFWNLKVGKYAIDHNWKIKFNALHVGCKSSIQSCQWHNQYGERGQSVCLPWEQKICQKLGKRREKSEKIRKKRKNRKEKAKIRKVLLLCPSWQIGLATLLKAAK